VPPGIKIDPADAEAIERALEELRTAGDLEGADEQDTKDEMLVALWRRHDIRDPYLKTACAALAARTYLRERAHVAPTDPIPHHHSEKPRQRTSWWGMLTATEDED
jgi:hypothetical protein